MFETAELGQKVSKSEYKEREPLLRQQLLEAQGRLRRRARFPVIVLFAGVDGAGKGESANLLNEWMDPRWIVTRAYDRPTPEELERPRFWRFWRDLPANGQLGVFLSAWYHHPLLHRVYRKTTEAQLDFELERIETFERMLADDGALILKFWMHLGRDAQRRRLKSLEKDPLQNWRVTELDWKHWRMYDRFVAVAERIIARTSTGQAPWKIVEGSDPRFRSLQIGTLLLEALERTLPDSSAVSNENAIRASSEMPAIEVPRVSVLSQLDTSKRLPKPDYGRKLKKLQGELAQLRREAREKDRGRSMVLIFEGWDAAGKGGAIRRITPAFDARLYRVVSIAAPNDEERSHHYLWRFWRYLPPAGRITIFDRSWYGRVLVERVEGFAPEAAWRRAFAEINDFEAQLVEHGILLLKFWLHITPEEQARRFKEREETPYKRWKLTDEDWRNREKWKDYETAVHAMVERTSTPIARWILVEAEDKRYARIKVLRHVRDAVAGASNGSKRKSK